ncbi:hypothetical protein QR680_013184 [Steinernema hermaphroditum]|uniref:Skp1-related protein n=1 Tax=Steinernema hermaphroditum TaxID=289476 RepID=A0AA39I4N1_9BILA|nr:hypothetical protein QR680_013184 [Steinernema hermaphroditum]
MVRFIAVSNDGRKFRISSEALQLSDMWSQEASKSETSSGAADESEESEQVELSGAVDGSTLQLLIEWCEHYRLPQRPPAVPEGDFSKVQFSEWDTKFLRSLSHRELQLLTMAAKYLKVRSLLTLCVRFIYTTFVREQTVEKVRAFFGESDDFSYEEKEYMRYEREWLNGNDVY